MNVAFAFLTLVTLAAKPEPLDAFRANFAAIKVDMEFTHQGGRADPALVGRLSSLKVPEFDATPGFGALNGRTEITGRWSSDGTTQLYAFGSPDWILQKIKDAHGGKQPLKSHGYTQPREALFDGKILAEQDQYATGRFGDLNVSLTADPFFAQGAGPFIWWWEIFPKLLDRQVAGVEPKRYVSQRDGHAVEVELYSNTIENPSGSFSGTELEIDYDPSLGHVPRYARSIMIANGKAWVREMVLIEARQCASDGFVPTEWYSAIFEIDDFESRYPTYTNDTVLKPTERIQLGHFKASSFSDRITPVALTHLAGTKTFYSYESMFALKPGTEKLTMSQIKSILGPWLDDPTHPRRLNPGAVIPSGPDPDADPNHLRPVLPWPVGVGFVLVAGFLLFRHRSRRSAKS